MLDRTGDRVNQMQCDAMRCDMGKNFWVGVFLVYTNQVLTSIQYSYWHDATTVQGDRRLR
jgi:hypothetical protein